MPFFRKIIRFFLSVESPETKSSQVTETKKNRIQQVIDNDPQIKKIDKEIEDIHSKYPIDPEFKEILKKYGAL